MRLHGVRAAALALAVVASSQAPAHAQDLLWEVVNPFRFYKNEAAFKLHEAAFKAVRGDGGAASDPQIIRKIERCLNDPQSLDGPMRTACEVLVKQRPIDPRLGWAASTLASTCYDYLTARPRRFPAKCEREHAGRSVLEDYILPESHTVSIGLSPARRAEARSGQCVWSVRPRAGSEWVRSEPQPCADAKSIEVPFAKDRAESGLEVKVDVTGGLTFTEQVIVEDLLVAALGDSFASGEGNPDRPVIFSPVRGLNYQTECNRPMVAVAEMKAFQPPAGRDSFILPRRLMKDEQQGGRQYDYCSDEFKKAFWERSAHWLSPDCHRSQYAFPMRVSLQIALEDRHRAVTLVHLACSGALVTEGLFKPLAAREHYEPTPNRTKMVPSQFEQLTKLICNVDARTRSANYPVKVPLKLGNEQLIDDTLSALWCPTDKRKREIDLVLLSVGGNDAGFSPLAAYTFLERASEIVPLAGLTEGQLRFGPTIAAVYLTTLRGRMDAVQKALTAGFGVDASRVIQASYENVEYSERGELCGGSGRERLGLDVHANFKFDARRVSEVNRFLTQLFNGLQCVTNGEKCPPNSPARDGTKFTLVSDHQPEFLNRGICAVDPQNASADERTMVMPRVVAGSLTPWTPSMYRAYAHRTRLFRTPNDAFLTANEHRGNETNLFDILQPPVAALFSGAFHPTAEAHSIVADHVIVHARRVLAERQAAR